MDPFLGQILLLPYDFVAKGFLACDGQLLPIAANPALFSLLGARFGGDGVVTFAVPDLTGKEPIAGSRYCIAVEGIYPVRPSPQ